MYKVDGKFYLGFFLGVVLAFCSAHADTDYQPPGIGQFLNESGRLSLPEDFSGSLDPRGFELLTMPDGTPKFVARESSSEVSGDWAGFGGVNFGCNSTVTAMAADASGMIYFGGFFSVCGGTAANHVVAYNPVTNQWRPLDDGAQNGVNNSVNALTVSGTDLYVAGAFTQSGGQTASRVARWDGSQWHALGSGPENGVNNNVNTLVVADGQVYVGGVFTEAGGDPANRVARWDGSQWHSLGSGTQNGVDGDGFARVEALTVDGSDIYVGGSFDEAGGEVSNNIARWDGIQWHSLGTGTQNGLNNPVGAMVVSGGDLFVGGIFSTAGGEPAGRIARWDGSAWHALGAAGPDNGVLGSVTGLGVMGSDLYVGGFFRQAGGMMVNYAARWDGVGWHALDDEGLVGTNAVLDSLMIVDDTVYLGGRFTRAGNTEANAIVRWKSGQWHTLGDGGQNGFSGAVLALTVSGSNIYVGGQFTWVGDISANHIARWDGSQWYALGSEELNGVSSGGSTGVRALAVDGDDLYVSGFFNQAGDIAANNIARWDGSEWHSLGDGPQNGLSSSVGTIAVESNNVYAGGYFTEAGGQPANRVARWDGSAWHSLGNGSENGIGSGRVEALAVDGNQVYVGGQFTQAGGVPANHVARWDGSSWHSLGSGAQNGVNSTVNAIAVAAGNAYVGGAFTSAGGEQATRIARWDGSQWHSVGTHTGDGLNWIVRSLALDESGLYLGGSFTQAGTIPANRIARWDGNEWQSLGSGMENGVSGDVFAVTVSDGKVYTGGFFSKAGGQVSSYFAAFVQPSAGLSLDALNFGTFEPGQSSEPVLLVITNDGGGNLDIGGVSIEAINEALGVRGGASFNIELEDCTGASLAPGESCTIEIIFSPTEPGLQQAVLRIDSNAPGSPTLVELTGNDAIFSNRFE